MNDPQIEGVLQQMRQLSAQAGDVGAVRGDQSASGVDFGEVLKSSIDQVNETQQAAGELRDAFVTGDRDVELNEVMLALQKANVSFQAMSEVRNNLVEAYRTIMRMQI